MMLKKKMVSVLLAVAMVLGMSGTAFAAGYEPSDVPGTIYDDPAEVGLLPPITTGIYYGTPNLITPFTVGVGEVIPRVREWQTASDGLYRCDSWTGTYLGIASVVLGFSGVAAAMPVAQILSVTGVATDILNASTPIQAETYLSYRYTYRDGEGRWSSDPDQDRYYLLGYRTGKIETFKHVMSAVRQDDNTWVTYMKDYTVPCKIEKTQHFDNRDWILEQGRYNIILGQVTDET